MSRADYVLGLIVGEGCFSVGIEYRQSYKYGIGTRWLFSISMSDYAAVENVKDEIGIDAEIKVREREGRSTLYEILARNQNDIQTVIDWVLENKTSEFACSNKAGAFERWKNLWVDRDRLMKSKHGVKELTRRAWSLNNSDSGKSLEEIYDHIEQTNG